MLVHRTSELKAHTGLVDYMADAECLAGTEWIPCRIGYLEYEYTNEPEYVFFNEGVTDKGTHYNKATFTFADNFNLIGE